MSKEFRISDDGIDYYFLIIKHLDRMSERLIVGLEPGKINTSDLVGYYEQVLHFECLMIPFLDDNYYARRSELEKFLPAHSSTWSGSLDIQLKYFMAVCKLFKLLLAQAYNERVLKLKIKREYSPELAQEMLFG